MSETEHWDQLNSIFDKGNLKESLEIISFIIQKSDHLSELARSSKTLAELHYSPSKDPQLRRTSGYALLSAHSQIQMGRFAPATALLDWLKTCKAPKEILDHLADSLSKTFSKEIETDRPQAMQRTPDEGIVGSKTQIPLFSGLSISETKTLIEGTKTKKLAPNEILFKEGDDPMAFYIVAEGEMGLFTEAGLKKDLKEGEFFGEIALLGNKKRTATLKAKTKVSLLEYSKSMLIDIFIHYPALEERLLRFYFWRVFQQLALQHPFFRDYCEEDLSHFFYLHKGNRVRAHTVLIQEEQPASRVLLLLDGEVEITQQGTPIGRAYPGDFLGEMGVLNSSRRSAQAATATVCDYLECPDYLFDSLCKQFPKLKSWLEEKAAHREAAKVSIHD
jgi:CRP-like cAMP-binding protein